MSSGKIKHRAVIHIPEIEHVVNDDINYARDMIAFHCNYDCYYFDCGLDCPKDCPILHYYDVLDKNQRIDEEEMLKELGLAL